MLADFSGFRARVLTLGSDISFRGAAAIGVLTLGSCASHFFMPSNMF